MLWNVKFRHSPASVPPPPPPTQAIKDVLYARAAPEDAPATMLARSYLALTERDMRMGEDRTQAVRVTSTCPT